MKNFGHLILFCVALMVCFGFTACGNKGGTLEFNNDRNFTVWVTLDIDGREIFSGYELLPGTKKDYSSDEDFNWNYVIRQEGVLRPLTGYGNITNGDTIVIWMSGIFK